MDQKYYLYRLYQLDLNSNQAELWVHRGKIEREKLTPNTYIAHISDFMK